MDWWEGGSDGVSVSLSLWWWSIITQDYQLYCLPAVAVELEVSGVQSPQSSPQSTNTALSSLQWQVRMSTMATIPLMEKPCAMCNDKKGLGAPPKPKNQVYSNWALNITIKVLIFPRIMCARGALTVKLVQLKCLQVRSSLRCTRCQIYLSFVPTYLVSLYKSGYLKWASCYIIVQVTR